MKKILTIAVILVHFLIASVGCSTIDTVDMQQYILLKAISQNDYDELITKEISLQQYKNSVEAITKFKTLTDIYEDVGIECIRECAPTQDARFSMFTYYTIHKIKNVGIAYGFFEYDEDELLITKNKWYIYTGLSKSDFEDIKVGSTLKDVMDIDNVTRAEFYTECNNYAHLIPEHAICCNYRSEHITKEETLLIYYSFQYDSTQGTDACLYKVENADRIVITSMHWSAPIPILEQDLPK